MKYIHFLHTFIAAVHTSVLLVFITGTVNFANVSLVQKMFSELNALTLTINCTHFLVVTYFLQEQKETNSIPLCCRYKCTLQSYSHYLVSEITFHYIFIKKKVNNLTSAHMM